MPGVSSQVLLVDDEPEHIGWLVDYLESMDLRVEQATDLRSAFAYSGSPRLVIVDMNIPQVGALTDEITLRSPLTARYPGLAVAEHFRNRGVGAHAVIAYTVHDDDELQSSLDRLSCRYVLKGRPYAIKQVIQSALGPPARRR